MMDYITKNKDDIEQQLGISLLLGSIFFLKKHHSFLKYFYKNYDKFRNMNYKATIDFSPFINNHSLQQYVLIPNLSCSPTKDLFKQHIGYINKNKIAQQSTVNVSFKQSCIDFEAEAVHNKLKYNIFCNCSSIKTYVSSSLLCNLINLNKNQSNKKLTMFAYGLMKYSKINNRLELRGDCFGTSAAEIDKTWRSIFNFEFPLILFKSFILGIALCLLEHQYDNILKRFNNFYAEPKLQKQQNQTIKS